MLDKNSSDNKYNGKFCYGVSMLCWAYNEEENIFNFLQKISVLLDKSVIDYEIIMIDDGSTDKTYEIAREFQENHPRLNIYRNENNRNVGYCSRRAIQLATKEFLFWQTVDWSYDIADLRNFLEYLKNFDVVQGVRRKPVQVEMKLFKPIVLLLQLFGMKHLIRRSDSVTKAVISVINYLLIRVFFRVPLSDFQNVTFYPTKWIQSIKYESNSSFNNPEGLIKTYWSGKTIKEVPINFIPRSAGRAKGTKICSIINSVWDIFRLWFKWVVLRKRNLTKKGLIYR